MTSATTTNSGQSHQKSSSRKIKTGDSVTLHYIGTLSDGSIFDTSQGRSPLTFTAGSGEVIPGFDDAVLGMGIGQHKNFTVASDQAYGPIRAELIKEIPKHQLPASIKPEVGLHLSLHTSNSQSLPAIITKVSEDNITLDLNHPLSSKDLTFSITIIGINDPAYSAPSSNHDCCRKDTDEDCCQTPDNNTKPKGCCGGGHCHR